MSNRYAQLLGAYLGRMASRFPGTWRVDGVTSVFGHHGNRIDVRLSPLSPSFSEKPYVSRALTGESGQSFRIHTSMLSRFVVGSTWHNGQLVFMPPPDKDEITIQPASALYIPLSSYCGLPPNWPAELLPQSYFPMASGNREALQNSNYAVVPVDNHPGLQFLIVPCIELLRFYFGVSSRMMTDMIRGMIGRRYADFSIENPVEHGFVKVRRKMLLSRPETLVIAQAMCSETARSAMFGVHNALAIRKLKNQSLDIECKFPCDGLVKLAVDGKRINVPTVDGKGQVWALFAMRLKTSNHRLNANHIDIIDELMAAKSSGQNDRVTYFPKDTPFAEDENIPSLNDMLKANQRLKRIIIRTDSERFPGLKPVRIHHPKETVGKEGERYLPITGEEVQVNAITPGDGDYRQENKKNQGLSEYTTESIDEASHIARDLDLFLDTCNILATSLKDSDWQCSFLTINPDPILNKPGYSRFENTPTTTWSTVNDRPRYLVLYEMVNAKCHYYLLEMELKHSKVRIGQSTALLFRKDRGAIGDEDWTNYLVGCVTNGRWATNDNRHNPKLGETTLSFLEEFFAMTNFHSINHPSSTNTTKDKKAEQTPASEKTPDVSTPDTTARAYDPVFWATKLQARLLSFSLR